MEAFISFWYTMIYTLNFYIPLNRLLFLCRRMAPAKIAHPPFFPSKALQNFRLSRHYQMRYYTKKAIAAFTL